MMGLHGWLSGGGRISDLRHGEDAGGFVGSLCIVTRYKFKLVLHQNRLSLLPEWNKCLE
jgi:hypothetical protein